MSVIVLLSVGLGLAGGWQLHRAHRLRNVAVSVIQDAVEVYAAAERLADDRAVTQEWTA